MESGYHFRCEFSFPVCAAANDVFCSRLNGTKWPHPCLYGLLNHLPDPTNVRFSR